MPQKVIKFTGINRNTNKFNGSGECDELINLRPVPGGGHRVIRHKRVVDQGINYDTFIEHAWGEYYNQIILEDGAVYWKNAPNGTTLITDEFEGLDVSISFAGNVLMIYCGEAKKQLVFKFEDSDYVSYDVGFMPITDIGFTYRYGTTTKGLNTATADDDTSAAYNAALQKAASGFYGKYPNGLCGAAVVGCAYELEDGSEVWSTAFAVANALRINNYAEPTINDSTTQVTVSGATLVSLKLTFGDGDRSNIRKVNIYATRPVFPYEVGYTGSANVINELTLDDVNLAGQPMYYQGSVVPETGIVSLTLDFGGTQAGETLMEVNSGCIERTGPAVSYNNRFHFYKSNVQHLIQIPTVSDKAENRISSSYWVAYVKFDNGWKLIDHKYRFSETVPNDFIYPMAGVKQLAFVNADYANNGDFSVPYSDMFFVNLKDSSAYNYSYAFDVTPTLEQAEWFEEAMREVGQVWGDGFDSKVLWKNETNAINVSAQYNPFVFPVEYSYGFGGEIIDIVTSYLPVSAVQYGQYPITVFTTNGIYALEQGNGSVLYGNIVPLQPYVLEGSALASPFGTFFVSGNNLYLLAGREAMCVSIALNGRRELNLRNLDSYNALCFDLAQMISKEEFETYLGSVTLFFDTFQSELWICSNRVDVPYSYVFNMNTKMFHKSYFKYARQHGTSRYAIQEDTRYGKDLVDIYDERDGRQDILLQSRPMPLEVFYTHIQRLLMFADAELTGWRKLCLSVFGSDNLQDWKCIISAQKYDVTLKQIRTNKAAKSYRDYIILISGTLDSGTDISDIIADYTVVQRRLG